MASNVQLLSVKAPPYFCIMWLNNHIFIVKTKSGEIIRTIVRRFIVFKKCLFTAVVVATAVVMPMKAQAETNLLVILDGSNSMWGQIDGKSKMETAQKTLGKLMSDLPADTKLGFMAYGHTKEKDCNDVELLSAIGKDKPEMINTLIHTIQPKGKTPIANALKKSKEAFKGHEGQHNNILLVSDGIESCDGDPCAVAKELKEAGLDVSAHVIGFGVTKEEGKQLTCIAENTGGKYFDAANANAFNDAIKEVTVLAQAEPEPAPEPVSTLAFEDDFKGKELAPHWDVINPNADRYIIDDGKLLLVIPGQQVMLAENPEFPNLMKTKDAMPDGDWTITSVVDFELQTASDKAYIGVMDDQNGWIAAGIYGQNVYGGCLVKAYIDKFEGGEHTVSEEMITSSGSNKGYPPCVDDFKAKGPMTITFTKTGRDYSAVVSYTQDGKEVRVVPDPVKMLKAKSNLFVGLGQIDSGAYRRDEPLESYLNIDSIKVTENK